MRSVPVGIWHNTRSCGMATCPLESTVDEVFEEPTWLLREQLAELSAAARTKSPHQH